MKKLNFLLRKDFFLFVIIILALFALFGWAVGQIIFSSYSKVFIPMAPATSVLFILLSTTGFLLLNLKGKKNSYQIVRILSSLILVYCGIILIDFIFDFSWDLENIFIENPGSFKTVPTGRMSPITLSLFILLSVSIISFSIEHKKFYAYLSEFLNLLVFFVSSVLLIGYLYNAPLLYGSSIIPVALPTALCFMFLSYSLTRINGFLFNLLNKNTTEYLLAKSFLPIVIAIVFLQGLLSSNIFLHINNPTLISALLLFFAVVISVFIIYRISSSVGKKLTKAEAALSESEEKYRLLHETAGVGIGFYTPEGIVISYNKVAALNMNGKPEDFIGKSVFDLFPKPDAEFYLGRIKKAALSSTPQLYEDNVELPTGVRWYNSIFTRIVDSNDRIAGIQIISTDITERNLAEEQQKNLTERFNRIASNVPGVIYEFCLYPDGTSNIPYASEGFRDLYELSPEDVKTDATPIYELIHPDDRESYFKSVSESAEKLTPWYGENRVILPSGKTIWVEGKATPQKLEDGTIIWQGYLNNVTERKNAEKMLHESEEKYRQLYESNQMPISIFDSETLKFLSVNNAFIEKYGYTKEEFLKMTVLDIRPEAEIEKLKTSVKTTDNRLVNAGVYLHKKKNGQIIHVEILRYDLVFEGKNAKLVFANDITYRIQAEEELRTSEAKFRATAEFSPLAIYSSSGPDQKGEYVNPAFSEIFGFTLEDVPTVGEWWIKAFPDEKYRQWVIDTWQKNIENANLNNTTVAALECVCYCKDGAQKIISWEGSNIGDQFWAFGLDLTERANAEIKIKESEANLMALINNTHDSIWSLDRGFNYIIFNKTYADHFFRENGFELEKGMNAKKQLAPEGLAFWVPMFESVFNGEKKVFEFNHIIEGITHYFQTSLNPIYEGEIVTGVSAMSVDITNIKQAEKALKESEERLRLSTELANVAVWEFDFATNSMTRSKNHDQLYGLEMQKKWEFETFLNATHPDDRDFSNEIIQKSAAPGGPDSYKFDFRVIYPGQSVHWLMVTGQVIERNENGEGLIVRGTLIDITNRKMVELEIKKLNDELEERVDSRTDELSKSQAALMNLVEDINEQSTQIEKNAKLLEAKNKELETFTYSVSHDLKAPLRGIDGYSRLLEESHLKKLDPEGQKFIKTIREGTKQMNQLIEDLLAYSRLERSTLRPSSINAKQFVNNLLLFFKNDILKSNIAIVSDVPDIQIIADSDGLTIALRNILENAIKFSSRVKSPEIKISLKEDVSSWLLSVEDNGIGFDMKYHKRIFEIFQRLNLPEQFAGTGIGLAMVQKSVERMGGKIWAESEVGKGAKFYIEISKE